MVHLVVGLLLHGAVRDESEGRGASILTVFAPSIILWPAWSVAIPMNLVCGAVHHAIPQPRSWLRFAIVSPVSLLPIEHPVRLWHMLYIDPISQGGVR
ncbi:MAG: hypothetical protein RLZZ450_1520 [Pseudomonadota bacterium]|jgi:hypothetical protein